MIDMRMSAQNPANGSSRGGLHNRFDVRFIVGARIDDNDFPGSDQVGIGSGTGHRSTIGRNDSRHEPVQGLRDARLKMLRGHDGRLITGWGYCTSKALRSGVG
jgi:hypothetical protein